MLHSYIITCSKVYNFLKATLDSNIDYIQHIGLYTVTAEMQTLPTDAKAFI